MAVRGAGERGHTDLLKLFGLRQVGLGACLPPDAAGPMPCCKQVAGLTSCSLGSQCVRGLRCCVLAFHPLQPQPLYGPHGRENSAR